eukprot:4802898-Lingulodinium_polyedra.AAC.1
MAWLARGAKGEQATPEDRALAKRGLGTAELEKDVAESPEGALRPARKAKRQGQVERLKNRLKEANAGGGPPPPSPAGGDKGKGKS